MITASAPHKKTDRISSQIALIFIGDAGTLGKFGNREGGVPPNIGVAWPNRRKGSLIKNVKKRMKNCKIKKSTPITKPKNVPTRGKNPRLSPAGNRLTITARIRRKNRLYTPHCLTRLSDETGMRKLFQWVCNDIKRLRLSKANPKMK